MMFEFERLETRRAAAVTALTIDVPSEVVPGEVFTVEVYAQEFDRFRDGLRFVEVDLRWNDHIEVTGFTVTDSLPASQAGELGDNSLTGVSGLAVLIGYGNAGRPIGSNGRELFATLDARASGAGVAGEALIEITEARALMVPTLEIVDEAIRTLPGTITINPAAADWIMLADRCVMMDSKG